MVLSHTNAKGNLELEGYLISNNHITSANLLGEVGAEWKFAGVGDFNGDGTDDLVLSRMNAKGNREFEGYVVSNNRVAFANVLGEVGADWQLGGFAADPPITSDGATSQLVQAMAGFGGSSGAGDGSSAGSINPNTSQQSLLTTRQHA
jgi:hypothetical protein